MVTGEIKATLTIEGKVVKTVVQPPTGKLSADILTFKQDIMSHMNGYLAANNESIEEVDILEEVVDDEEEKPESSGKQKGKGKKRKGGPVV